MAELKKNSNAITTGPNRAPARSMLKAVGFTDEDLMRIRSPLGLDLGGRSPQEIALSIAAGLVAARSGRAGGWLDAR